MTIQHLGPEMGAPEISPTVRLVRRLIAASCVALMLLVALALLAFALIEESTRDPSYSLDEEARHTGCIVDLRAHTCRWW